MDFSLTILGSGGALPTPDKHPSAQCLQAGNQFFLIDAGEGVQVQLSRLGISHNRIKRVFISHLHGDHYLGLMGLLFSMHLARRQEDLHLYSIPGLDEMIRLHLRHARSALSYCIHFHPLTSDRPEMIHEDEVIEVKSFPLNHRIPCYGFLFKEKPKPRRMRKDRIPENIALQHIVRLKAGETIYDDEGKVLHDPEVLTFPPFRSRAYAYCSDTAWFSSLPEMIKGTNLIYHEATFHSADQSKADETFHSTALQAGRVAKEAGAERLLIGHLSGRYKDQRPLLDEARSVFQDTELAAEGSVWTVAE